MRAGRTLIAAGSAAAALIACTEHSDHAAASPSSAASPSTGASASADASTVAPAPPPGAAPDAAPAIHDWPTYHYDAIRSGNSPYIGTVHSGLHQVWSRALDGAVYAAPIVAAGHIIVATENDTVYEMRNNAVVWKRHLGTPVPQSSLPCGDINPLGITGTPIYDKATDTVVVVAELANPTRHTAVGLDPATGRMKWFRRVDVPSSVPGITAAAMQERGALAIAGHSVYVPYGGLAGDCSSYRGSVVGLDLQHPTTAALTDITVPTSREAGIWTPPGPSRNTTDNYLFVAVGNGATGATGTYDRSDSVLKISATGILDSFSPSTWRADNSADLDLGSQGPAIVGNHIFTDGKRGTAYVLSRTHLGGIGGELHSMPLCQSFGGTAVSGSTVYVPCTDGIRAVRINSDGTMTVLWHTQSSVTGSPVIGGGRVWAIDRSAGRLDSLDPATGAVKASVSIGAVNRFATPTLVQRSVLIGTISGIKAFNWT